MYAPFIHSEKSAPEPDVTPRLAGLLEASGTCHAKHFWAERVPQGRLPTPSKHGELRAAVTQSQRRSPISSPILPYDLDAIRHPTETVIPQTTSRRLPGRIQSPRSYDRLIEERLRREGTASSLRLSHSWLAVYSEQGIESLGVHLRNAPFAVALSVLQTILQSLHLYVAMDPAMGGFVAGSNSVPRLGMMQTIPHPLHVYAAMDAAACFVIYASQLIAIQDLVHIHAQYHLFTRSTQVERSAVVEVPVGSRANCLVDQEIPWSCHGAGQPSPPASRDKGKENDSTRKRRTSPYQSESSKDITGSSEPSPNQTASSKHRRTSYRNLTFACPFTKKDPMSHRDCYKYTLSRIRDVKQHLARCHRNPPYCPRCIGTFQTEEERDNHVREFSCDSRSSIKLEGITESQRSQLAKKSASNASPEAQWFAVFDILFPGHEPRPQSPYIDSELLQDITLYQEFLASKGPRILSDVLTQRGAITWNLPNEERDLAAFQQTVFEEGLGIIFEQWLNRRNGSTEDLELPSNSRSIALDTAPSSSQSRRSTNSTSITEPRALPPESMESLLVEEPLVEVSEQEDILGFSSETTSFSEGLHIPYKFNHGDTDFLSGLPDGGSDDELMRLFIEDASGGQADLG